MFIIFEGIDGVGKTTLINKFIKRYPNFKLYNNLVHHENRTTVKSDMFAIEMETILKIFNVINNNNNIIFDRLYLSEWVYGIILRNYNELEQKRILDWDKCFAKFNPILFYITCDKQILKKRLINTKDFLIIEKMDELSLKYREIISKSQIKQKYLLDNSNGLIYHKIEHLIQSWR